MRNKNLAKRSFCFVIVVLATFAVNVGVPSAEAKSSAIRVTKVPSRKSGSNTPLVIEGRPDSPVLSDVPLPEYEHSLEFQFEVPQTEKDLLDTFLVPETLLEIPSDGVPLLIDGQIAQRPIP